MRTARVIRSATFGASLVALAALCMHTSRASGPEPQAPPRDVSTAAGRETAGTSTVSGVVVLREAPGRMTPVRRARVTLTDLRTGIARTSDADVNGQFQFDGLPAAAYRVSAEKAGFVRFGAGTVDDVEPDPLVVGAGQSTSVELRMEPAAALEGRVLTETGEPAEGVVVSAVAAWPTPGVRAPVVVQQARSDDRGGYRVHTLPAGDFYLTAAADPLAVYQDARAPGERVTGVARTFYPGSPSVDTARPISVRPGEEIRQLDFTVTTVPLSSVRGRVVADSGQIVASYNVRLQPLGNAWRDLAGLIDPRTYEFQFGAVPPGEYWLLAAGSVTGGTSGASAALASQRLLVDGTDRADVVVRLVRPAILSGRIISERGERLPQALAVQVLETAFEMPTAPGAARTAIGATRDGTLPPFAAWGPSLVRVAGLPDGWAVASVVIDGLEVTDTPVDFASRAYDVQIAITDATGAAAGVVQSRGRPVRARVIAFARDERRWGPGSRFVKATTSAEDGRFVLDGLLPGEYGLVAVGKLPVDGWTDRALLRQLAVVATQIAVSPGTRTEVSLERRDRP